MMLINLMRLCIGLIAFNSILFVLYLTAQGSITGTVVDRDTQRPLPGANVYLQGTVMGSVTDTEGAFRIRNVPAGRFTLIVTMIGYERFVQSDVSLQEYETRNFTIQLTPTVIETSPVVVTAMRTERSLRDIPTSIAVLQAHDIERRNIFSVDEVLRTLPGVHFNLSQINIRGSSGYSHGAGSRVLLMIDGVPLLAGDTGEITWELIPVDQIERIEVVKGAGSTLYGSSALGGVVNIITRDLPQRPVFSARLQGGMYDEPIYSAWRWSDRSRFKHRMELSHGRQIGNVQIAASLGTLYDDSYRQNDSRRRTSGYFKGRYNLSPYQAITVSGFFIDQVRHNFLYWRSFENALVPFEDQVGEEVESFRIQSNIHYRHVFGSESFLTGRVSWYHSDWKDNIGVSGNASRSDVIGAELQFNHVIGQGHFLVTGIDASVQRVDSDIFGKRDGYVFAVYGQDEWTITDALRFIAGLRFDITRLDTIDTFMNTSPRAGITYTPLPSLSFRATAGAGFRAPAPAEAFATTAASGLVIRPNPDLDAERSWSFEVGANFDVSRWLNLDASLFQNEYRDMIEPAITSFEPLTAQFVNLVRARVRGFETGITTSLFDRMVNPRFAYTYIHGRDLDLDEPLKYRHRHMFVTGVLARYRGVWIELDYRYMSKAENIDSELALIIDNVHKRVPVHVVDVSAGVEGIFAGVPLRFSAGVKNLLQYNYVEFVANVQPIRQFIASMQVVM